MVEWFIICLLFGFAGLMLWEMLFVRLDEEDDEGESEVVWVPFWFDGNNYFGLIKGPKDWAELREAYSEWTALGIIDRAREATYGGTIDEDERRQRNAFGFRRECDGRPLREFLVEHGMLEAVLAVRS